MVNALADAFEDAAKWRKEHKNLTPWLEIQEKYVALFDGYAKLAPPWGLDAVPLMRCQHDKPWCRKCRHNSIHEEDLGCVENDPGRACPPCVQVGWRERSKP